MSDEELAPGLEPLPDDVMSGRVNPRSGTTTWGNRGGPSDTTMLVWKVIEAHPGITMAELFVMVEERIPSGWALRRWSKTVRGQRFTGEDAFFSRTGPAHERLVRSARKQVLVDILSGMAKTGSVKREGSRGARRYTAARPLKRYLGNPDLIDMPGSTRAADHLRAAAALQVVEEWVRRTESSGHPVASLRERQAIAELARAYRAKRCLVCGGELK